MRYLEELVKVTHGLPGDGTPSRSGGGPQGRARGGALVYQQELGVGEVILWYQRKFHCMVAQKKHHGE